MKKPNFVYKKAQVQGFEADEVVKKTAILDIKKRLRLLAVMCHCTTFPYFMRKLPLLLLLTLSLSCENRESKIESDSSLPPAYVQIDTIDGQQFRAVIQEGKADVPLSESEIHLVDSLLQQQIDEYNRKSDKSLSINLAKYKRQYFPTTDTNGHKQVEVNCFCQVHNNDDWKRERVQVDDGGKCYFNLEVNLTTKRVLSLHINGRA